MFTGIIRDIGTVAQIDRPVGGDMVAHIRTKLDEAALTIGASVACAGVCLTVVTYADGVFSVQASAETLSKTNLGQWEAGRRINLEPSLKMGDELGGHLVFGHVDGLAIVEKVKQVNESYHIRLAAPPHLSRYLAAKGSVALDGTSLTVNEVDGDMFDIMIIPHTWTHTTFGKIKAGDRLHIEIDMMARYAERILAARGL